jgi:hypothetical protein
MTAIVAPPLAPMLARLERELPLGDDVYEPKWDGLRCLAFRHGADVDLRSRNQRPLARYFPEIVHALVGLPDERLTRVGGSVAEESPDEQEPAVKTAPPAAVRISAEVAGLLRAADGAKRRYRREAGRTGDRPSPMRCGLAAVAAAAAAAVAGAAAAAAAAAAADRAAAAAAAAADAAAATTAAAVSERDCRDRQEEKRDGREHNQSPAHEKAPFEGFLTCPISAGPAVLFTHRGTVPLRGFLPLPPRGRKPSRRPGEARRKEDE